MCQVPEAFERTSKWRISIVRVPATDFSLSRCYITRVTNEAIGSTRRVSYDCVVSKYIQQFARSSPVAKRWNRRANACKCIARHTSRVSSVWTVDNSKITIRDIRIERRKSRDSLTFMFYYSIKDKFVVKFKKRRILQYEWIYPGTYLLIILKTNSLINLDK